MKYKEANYYAVLDKKKEVVQCKLCPNMCVISEGKTGSCRVRKNISGKLYSLNYGKLVSLGVDNIEKKPLYHFMPGTFTLSLATVGCNLHCMFCQNYQISQSDEILGEYVPPEKVVNIAIERGLKSISYTYTEPSIFFEYMLDVAKIAKKRGILNIIVSNGYINEKPLEELAQYIDAANIDFKSIDSQFYRKYCGVKSVSPVIRTIKYLKSSGVHVEVTNLIIEPINSSEDMIRKLCKAVALIGMDIPLHFSAFYPVYKMVDGFSRTNTEVLLKAKEIANSEGMKYVYLGNISTENDTFCDKCGALLVKRAGFDVKVLYDSGACLECGKILAFKSK